MIRPDNLVGCQQKNETLDPGPIQKWAEESYVVTQVTLDAETGREPAQVQDRIDRAVQALFSLPQCDRKNHYGLLGM